MDVGKKQTLNKQLGRGNIFKDHGYDPLFIWESELTNTEQIKNKLKEFHER